MDHETTLDDRGRITIRKDFRKRLGRDVVQVLTPRGILLRPRAKKVRGIERLPPVATISGEDDAAREAP